MKKSYTLSIVGVAIAVVILIILFKNGVFSSKTANFAECEKKGYPIQQSYPRKCTAADGQVFTEKITTGNANDKKDLIIVKNLQPNDIIASPVKISGEARGYWFFEASFPVKVNDAEGNELGVGIAQAKSDWMTEEFVPFEATVSFSSPQTETGLLVLEKDNPSGLPENDDALVIPVKFSNSGQQQSSSAAANLTSIKLYYYNKILDQALNSNISCNPSAVAAVKREIPATVTPLKDSINLLLKGELTDTEKTQGYQTEFSADKKLKLVGVAINNGVATLQFEDPGNFTSGGSCRIGILRSQIEKTAKQFSTVKEVKLMPETLFQP